MRVVFGIAKPCRHELTPELRRQYRAHMCGLCLALRDGHGQPARAVTNVDAIGLSVLAEAQRPAPLDRVDVGPCPLRGMQPASVVAAHEPAVAHAAAVSLLAAAVKIRDHAVDRDGPVGRVPATSVRIARRLDGAGRRRAAVAGFDPETFDRAVDRSAVVERRHGLRFEDWSAPTEAAMADAARHTGVVAGRPENDEALAELGAMFGRLTYLLDAVEDEADDQAAGRFNALVAAEPDPAARPALAQRLFVDAHTRLAAAFDRLVLDRPELARHLLVDQLERRGRRIVGLPAAPTACATSGHHARTHHADTGHHHRHRHPVAAVAAGLVAWVLASAGVNAGGWGPYPPGYGPGIPPDQGKKKKKQQDADAEPPDGCCEDCDCNPCDGDGCGCGCCDGDCCGGCDCGCDC